MKISAKLSQAVLITTLLAASFPTASYARGEDAAINRNDPMSSTVMDRTNSRTESWTSAPNWNYRKNNTMSDRAYDNNGNMVNSNQTTYNRNTSTNNRNYYSNRY